MKKFRKKPVIIEAIQYNGNNFGEIQKFCGCEKVDINLKNQTVIIKTLEGDMECSANDWVIRGIKGEYYPCKPDIFNSTYEEVAEE